MIPGIPDVAVGATLAALIAGILSLLGLIVAKENKVLGVSSGLDR